MRSEWKKQKRKVDADRAEETGRDLITQGHEDQVKAFRAYPKSKVKPENDFSVRGLPSRHYGCSTQRIGRQQESCEETKGWSASPGQR